METNTPIGIQIENPIIYDKNGLFYEGQGIKRINLPAGEYEINGKYKQIPFIHYELPRLPFPEKIYAVPKLKNIKIEFIEGLPYKAQIDIHQNLMQFSEEMRNATSPEFFCVLFHELGHYKYFTEDKCDLYAIWKMLQIGFNPSQFLAFLGLLHSENRKEKAVIAAIKSDNERTNPVRHNRLFPLFNF